MDSGAASYQRFLQGDDSGFDELLELYRCRLIFFIHRYVQNLAVAEDLAEDTFLELLIHKHRYNFKTPLKTYLFAIGRNKALNFLKRESRRVYFPLHSFTDHPTDSDMAADIPEETCLEEQVLRSLQARELSAALNTLKDDYRAAVHLVYFEELSLDEAAKALGKTKKQTENLLYRAKCALRTTLRKEDFVF